MTAAGRRFRDGAPRLSHTDGGRTGSSIARRTPPGAGILYAETRTPPPFPVTPPALVLSGSTAVCEAVILSLNLQEGAPMRIDTGSGGSGSRGWGVAHPELAIVVESDVALAVAAVRAVKRRWPQARVLVVGLRNREDAILRCIDAGADGLVSPDESLDQLAAAVREVLMNAFRAPPHLLRPLFDRLVRLDPERHRGPPWVARLSTRESEVLGLLARGSSNKDIAGELHLELQTVKNHIGRILRKLGVHSRFDAVRVAPVVGEVS